MKIDIIAEIGLNHLGNEKYLAEYLKVLSKKKLMEYQFKFLKIFNEK